MTARTGVLVLVRHGQSTDNALNLFSGWRDPALTAKGVEQARDAGRRLAGAAIAFDIAFTSSLGRARRTLDLILERMPSPHLPIVSDKALDERHYGELAGLNKTESCATFGAEQVHLWRKSYDAVPPGGESLAMTAARTVPFFEREIFPRLRQGENVLVVAHGNSLRSIVKHLDDLSDAEIVSVRIATSEILVYDFDTDGVVQRKAVLPPVV